jgi:23S rRNA pseudouridine1911/1915/1917 synthase
MAERPASGPGGRLLTIAIPGDRRGERLDQVLAALVPDASRASIQRLLRAGCVVLSAGQARASYRVRGGETARIEMPSPSPSGLVPEDLPIAVLFEDDAIVVVDKPPGMVVHPGAGARTGTLVHALLHRGGGLSVVGGVERPGIVHRLDRDTSGVLVIARSDAAHRDLSRQFKARTVRKTYEALVWGAPRSREGLVEAPIGRHPTARTRMAIRDDGRPSRTRYRVARALGPVTLLEVFPETGRTHQIRVHLASLKHPIVGDRLYGGRRAASTGTERARAALAEWTGLALHSRRLAFAHPGTGAWMEIEAPRPPAFEALLESLA